LYVHEFGFWPARLYLHICLNLQGLEGLKELVVETNQLVLERVGTIAQTDGCRKEHYH
jgi:hypothetical protein